MARNPDIPDAFDVYTVVVLRRPDDAPEMSDEELDALQARHLAYRADLWRQGVVVVNGPFDQQSDPVVSRDVDLRLRPLPRPHCSRTATHQWWRGGSPTT